MKKIKEWFLHFVSKRDYIITYHQDGELGFTYTFIIRARSKSKAIWLLNSYDVGGRIDIISVDVC